MNDLSGKRVLVTGGLGTLGRAYASAFAAAGTHVTVLDRPGMEPPERADWLGADLNDLAGAEAAVATAAESPGFDILINNAALIINKPHDVFSDSGIRGSDPRQLLCRLRACAGLLSDDEGQRLGEDHQHDLHHPERTVGRICALCRLERRDAPAWRRSGARLVDRIGIHNLSLLLALAILLAIFGGLRGDIFFSARNILNIGLAVTILGVLAMSQTLVIVSGGLDISVGAIVGLTTVSTALAIEPAGPAAGIVAGLVIGGVAGLFNGLVITYGRVNPVIVTLGTMAIFRGIAFILTDGQSVSIFDDTFRFIGRGEILGLPFPIWVLIATAVLFHVFLSRTIAGRNVYALGGNPVVARFSGINVPGYRVAIYVMSGVAAGIGGILLAARTGSGQPISGSQGLELEAITAAVLGGCALAGGKGTIPGALLGVAVIGILNNGMILTAVPTFYQLLAKGSLLILAVVLAEYRQNRGA